MPGGQRDQKNQQDGADKFFHHKSVCEEISRIMLVSLLMYGFFQKINDIGSMGVGLEDSVHPDLFEFRNIIVRNDAPPKTKISSAWFSLRSPTTRLKRVI